MLVFWDRITSWTEVRTGCAHVGVDVGLGRGGWPIKPIKRAACSHDDFPLLPSQVWAEAGVIIPVSLFSLGIHAEHDSPAWVAAMGFAIFVLGTTLNVGSELQRHRFKQDPRNKGQLYTGGMFQFARHINYTGEILSFVGWGLLTGHAWNQWVPLVMGLGMAGFSVPELQHYLALRYASQWEAYRASVQFNLIPGVW